MVTAESTSMDASQPGDHHRDTSAKRNSRNDDPFDSLLSLEEDYYTEGYSLGLADGTRSGRIEGRLFGLEKGFDKFVQMGRLSGRAAVWQARLPSEQSRSGAGAGAGVGGEDVGGHAAEGEVLETAGGARPQVSLPSLSGSDRLRRHIDRLVELTDPESLETKNNEDAVNECDERLAGAKAKFTLISRIVGEADGGDGEREGKGGGPGEAGELGVAGEDEDVEVEITAPRRKGSGKVRAGTGGAGTDKVKGSGKGEMEDFVGLPLVKKVEKGS